MNILAFDTTASASSVAILSDGELICSERKNMKRGHAEALVPMIKEVISPLSLKFKDIDLIAVTRGPGSFTGVRIGLATARSLSVVTKIPLAGVTSFEAVAAALVDKDWNGKPVLVALETKRDDLYIQIFEHTQIQLCKSAAIASSDLPNYIKRRVNLKNGLVIAGDGAERAAAVFEHSSCKFELKLASSLIGPDARQVAQIAYEHHLSGNLDFSAEPIYLRAPDVHVPKTNLQKN